jgi:glycosyltransferase involved in cell wall biosynthesis
MDNQWLGTAKQWLGILSSRFYLRPLFDVAFLPGDRQADFARRLGFCESRIWWGYYTCDHSRFLLPEDAVDPHPSKSFLFVGRLVEAKGIADLMAAYSSYRLRTDSAWPLMICGTGPLERHVRGVQGVDVRGFVQPSDLPEVFAGAGCLVLPSVFEPWGVVVHEATAAGLPIICSTACGAAPHLVEDGYNGFLVGPGDPEGLSSALLRFTLLDGSEQRAMSLAARSLSFRYTPDRWAQTLISRSTEALGSSLRRHA